MELVETPNDQIKDAEIRQRDMTSSRCGYTRNFVAVDAGFELGLLSVDFMPKDQEFVIYEISVPPPLRRDGIVTQILDAAEVMGREHGYDKSLLVPKTLDEAFSQDALENWYARKGYVLIEDSANSAWLKTL